MGNPMTRRLVLPHGRAGAPTPLLRFIAGGHADLIAAGWPAPHAGFFALPTARRHAAAILLSRGNGPDEAVYAAERARDPDVARLLMGGEAPGGLMKALGRLGEPLWENADYDLLLDLFAKDETALVLRHTDDIRAPRLRMIGILPAILRVQGILMHVPENVAATEDLAEAFRLAVRIHGAKAETGIARRWERAGTPQRLFDMAAEDLQPVAFGALLPPPVLPPAFFRVDDRKTLVKVALEFRNCLRDFTADLANGRMAVYVLRDGAERAAIALRQDPAGWRLAEALGPHNEDLRDETLRFIIDAVERAGGRTGESTWAVANGLHDHVCRNCGPPHVPRRETWRDRLALGTLWD